MSTDNTKLIWTARIALFAMVPAVVGGLWLFNDANADTELPTTAVATSCSGFEADAYRLFDNGDTAALRGRFAPGDHVHLAIDFNGVGHSWELTGVLTTKPGLWDWIGLSGSGQWTMHTESTYDPASLAYPAPTTSTTTTTFTTSTKATKSTTSSFTAAQGDIGGFARLEVEIDVTTAGDGAITINKPSSVSLIPPRVASASCNASTRPTA